MFFKNVLNKQCLQYTQFLCGQIFVFRFLDNGDKFFAEKAKCSFGGGYTIHSVDNYYQTYFTKWIGCQKLFEIQCNFI